MTPGVTLYVGIRQCGKTTKAKENIGRTVEETGWPVLTLNATGADNLNYYRHVETCLEAARSIWDERRHAAIIPRAGRLTADNPAVDEVRLLMGAATNKQAGRAVILLDEFGFWARGNHVPEEIMNALRTPTHTSLDIHLTTQHLGDLNPAVFQCVSVAHIFRVSGDSAKDRVRKIFGLDPEKVSALGQGEHLTVKMGF